MTSQVGENPAISQGLPSTSVNDGSDNSSKVQSAVRSHGKAQPQSRPLTRIEGSNRVSNKQKASTEITNTTASKHPRSQVPCKFALTKKGCRAGAACPFLHTEQQPHSGPTSVDTAHNGSNDNGQPVAASGGVPDAGNVNTTHQSTSAPRAVVSRPVPSAQRADPRDFNIRQVTRRFNPAISQSEHGTVLVFKLVPSDPDFPFELDGLRCTLAVPRDYPQKDARPSLKVTNSEMDRGFQINCERGFDSLVGQYPTQSLLSLLNEFDKNLETFLTAQKAQTIKISANASRHTVKPPSFVEKVPVQTEVTAQPPPRYSEKAKSEARTKRMAHTSQLESRLRNVPNFSKSTEGSSFNIPISIPKPARLPVSLQPIKEVTLTVPILYPLEPCAIRLKGVSGEEAQNVVRAFDRHVKEEPPLTLMAHINFLSQNMHLMAQVRPPTQTRADEVTVLPPTSEAAVPAQPLAQAEVKEPVVDADRPHIQVIPRPPEFGTVDESEDESSEYDSQDHSGSEDAEAEEQGGGAVLPAGTTAAPTGNSILLSFPDLELYGIELLEISSLSLTLKCDRCKSNVDAQNIKAKTTDVTTTVSESCPKCAVIVSASYTAEPLFASSIKAGYLDLHGCTVADMLPSVFKPTCSGCSTTYPYPPGVVSVRGETTLAVCRSCHQKMTFKIPEAKFLRVSSALASSLPLRQKKKKENLGIVSGTPLPNFGRCSHYRKSQRWFRFSCCQKVYPCDRCHDEQADPKHSNEHANRMICGYCSREQNYRPEDCGVCHASLVGRKGGGFWEGGKGTRDKLRMSRKDPRKYKRRGGGAMRQT